MAPGTIILGVTASDAESASLTFTWETSTGTLTEPSSTATTDEMHSLALRDDGTVWAWGDNLSVQLGDGTNTSRHTPVQVPGLTGVTAVAVGPSHSLALLNDGSLWAWGMNDQGQLGDGVPARTPTPVAVGLP